MTPLPHLTEAFIRQNANPESFQRGRDYYRKGAVTALEQRGRQLTAEVEGSQYAPYLIRLSFDAAGLTTASCSCPYDWGGYCKHLVAVLLAVIHAPETIEARSSLGEILAPLDRDDLQQLLLQLAERRPELTDLIETLTLPLGLPGPLGDAPPVGPRQTSVDPAPFRKQIRTILRHAESRYEYDYNEEDSFTDEILEVLAQIDPFIQAGDTANALPLLQAITEECLDEWGDLEDYAGDSDGFFDELGQAWAEALLVTELPPAERNHWLRELEKLRKKATAMNGEDGFEIAIEAARQGWDYPPLVRVLGGEITHLGARAAASPYFSDDLALIRLTILARQGRHEAYLHLAEAEGQNARYLTKLVELDRAAEAVAYALAHVGDSDTSLTLAKALRAKNELEAALQIAEHGLALEGHVRIELARWLRDTASGVGQPARALSAARIAYSASLNLGDYQAVQALAGPDWPTLKPDLLAALAASGNSYAAIDIYLHEGMVAEAIQAIEKGGLYSSQLEQVVAAATHSHPDWAIRQACKQAEAIMDAKQSNHYARAVNWLRHARLAYNASGQHTEWRAYLDTLLVLHARKSSLIPQLKTLLSGLAKE